MTPTLASRLDEANKQITIVVDELQDEDADDELINLLLRADSIVDQAATRLDLEFKTAREIREQREDLEGSA